MLSRLAVVILLCCILFPTYALAGSEETVLSTAVAVNESKVIDADSLASLVQQTKRETPYTLVDARPSGQFNQSHIPTAISIENKFFDQNIDSLPDNKDELLIYYCGGTSWGLSYTSARRAVKLGYKNVKVLLDGLPAWESKGFLTEKGEKRAKGIGYGSNPKSGVLAPEDFFKAVNGNMPNVLVLDVRNDEEVEEGQIVGSVAIPTDEIIERIVEIPKSKEIFIYCRSGSRAEKVYSMLTIRGYSAKYLDMNVTIRRDGTFILSEKMPT